MRDAQRLDRLAHVLVWSGVLQAMLEAVLYSLKADYRIFFSDVFHSDMVGTFVNRNHQAGYLCMCLSIGIGLMLARRGGSEERPSGFGHLGLLVGMSAWKVLTGLARRRSNLPRGIAFGVTISIVALLVHSTVDFNLQIPANALTRVVILAMGWIAYQFPSPGSRRSSDR